MKMKMFLLMVPGLILAAGCKSWPTTDKSINAGGEVEALKVETAGGSESGTPLPNVLGGGGAHAYQSSAKFNKGQSCPPMYLKANQSTLLSQFLSIFGFSASGYVEAYTGCPGETAAETAARLAAFRSADTTATSWQKLKVLFGGDSPKSSDPKTVIASPAAEHTDYHLLGTVSRNGLMLGPGMTSTSGNALSPAKSNSKDAKK